MALTKMRIHADALGHPTECHVWLPDQIDLPEDLPVLYLLHGLTDDYYSYVLNGPLFRHVGNLPVAIVMPQAERSYYTDMAQGEAYWTFIRDELPTKLKRWFKLTSDPKKTFVAGLSMGGYGTLKWVLQQPEKFAAAWALSPAVDISAMRQAMPERNPEFDRIFGPDTNFATSSDNLFYLLDQVSTPEKMPVIHQYCGTEDYLYQDNLKFAAAAKAKLANYRFSESPGLHDWDYWSPIFDQLYRDLKNYL